MKTKLGRWFKYAYPTNHPSSTLTHTYSLPSPLPPPSFHRDGVVVMGIPKLFRWLVDLYPSVQQRVSETLGTETAKVENFYLDMNGIIHMCTHANAEELILLDERKMFQRIFTYTDRLYKIVAPTRVRREGGRERSL